MSLSQNHQKLMKEFYPDFKVKEGEESYFHILFVKILPDGDRVKDNPMIQIFNGKDWAQVQTTIKKRGIKAVTQYNEVGVIYDPTEYEKAKAAELEKAEKEKAEKAKKEAEELVAKKAEEKAAEAKKPEEVKPKAKPGPKPSQNQ